MTRDETAWLGVNPAALVDLGLAASRVVGLPSFLPWRSRWRSKVRFHPGPSKPRQTRGNRVTMRDRCARDATNERAVHPPVAPRNRSSLSDNVLPTGISLSLKHNFRRIDPLYQAAKRLRNAARAVTGPRSHPGIPGRVHPNDTMMERGGERVARYGSIGEEAVTNIGDALTAADRDFGTVRSALDLGCGYGRVLRYLTLRIPAKAITASDIDRAALSFCEKEFGVRTLRSTADFDSVQFDRYDLVWSGSLVTHLNGRYLAKLLDLLAAGVTDGGVLVFSTHGQHSLDNVGRYGEGRYLEIADEIRDTVAGEGMCYLPYEGNRENYGIAWHTADYIDGAVKAAMPSAEQLWFRPQGWDNHQDVFAYRLAGR